MYIGPCLVREYENIQHMIRENGETDGGEGGQKTNTHGVRTRFVLAIRSEEGCVSDVEIVNDEAGQQ